MSGDIVAVIAVVVCCLGHLVGVVTGYRSGIAYAATMSLSNIPRNDWLEAVIDAKARKEKEALK